MKYLRNLVLIPLLPLAALAASSGASAGPANDQQKTLYSLGVAIGRQLGAFNLKPTELNYVIMGLKDQVHGTPLKAELRTYGPKIEELAKSRQEEKAKVEKAKGKAYLDTMAKEPGAEVAQSGLIYIPITKGTGDSPKATDKVRVHYTGTLIDGKVFDSSIERGQPIDFPLNGVIPCWTEGLQKMKSGGKAKLVCPSEIAYGDRGSPPVIPGGATLTFDVQLLDINPKTEPPSAQPSADKSSNH